MTSEARRSTPRIATSGATTSLHAPSLLIAMPGMDDGFFGKSVVLLIEHSDEGTGGIVLNRVAPVGLDTLLESADLHAAPTGPHPVWIGGPVAPQTGLVLYVDEGGERYDHDVELLPGLRLSASMNVLRDVAEGQGPRQFALFLGRAGWGPGQLETELAAGSWLTAEADPELLFATDGEATWHKALAKLDIDAQAVVREVAEA